MNLFQSTLRKCESLGISPNHSRFNGKLLMASMFYWFNNTLNCIFCLREVTNFSEFANSIFITLTTTSISMCFTILVIKTSDIFRLIDDAERIIEHGIKCRSNLDIFKCKCNNTKILKI